MPFSDLYIVLAFGAALILLSVVVPPVVAARKGYKWYLWLPGGGMFGLLILAFLPAANKPEQSAEEQQRLRSAGNGIGGILSALSLGFFVFRLVMGMASTFQRTPEEQIRPQPKNASVWKSRFHPVRVAY